jgi:hypothetical protein
MRSGKSDVTQASGLYLFTPEEVRLRNKLLVQGGVEDQSNKSPKTRTELEALVLARLRAAPQCSGASHVTVVPYADHRVTATWEVASFNPGISEWEKCERVLCEIVSRLQQCFDLSQ